MKKIVVVILILSGFKSSAQIGVWSKITAEANIVKNLELEVNAQARTSEIGTPFKSFLGEAGLKYDLPKGFSLAAFYRLIAEPDAEKLAADTYHRFYGELKYKTKAFEPLRIGYRLRYQQQFKDDLDGLSLDANYLRNKVEISTKLSKKIEPYLSADLFYETGGDFDQLRYTLGTEYDISKKLVLDLGFQTDDRLNSSKSNQWRINWGLKFKIN
ncbi:DUF2490 domain-containing protein [Jiulongibacter sediminis]|jgi:hypothetical protein|uniref:DUF2490 domain-containing protein n=1 Tax=Jiulongibacter sediminis TaxID=1605367 RepID=UPI0026E9DCF8|nr:DUF2490 domain-containing protein [Jiulongibacter sediminis]